MSFYVGARLRAARERAGRIEKVGKLRATRETGEAPSTRDIRDGAAFRLRGAEIPRVLAGIWKTMPRICVGREERGAQEERGQEGGDTAELSGKKRTSSV